MATISSTHYLLSTSSKQRNKCSRIELKMTETETKQLQRSVSTFAMQLALRLCFCQMPNASITKVVSSETLKCSGGVTRQIHPHRRSGDTTTPNRRMEPDQGYGPLPRCPKLTVDERAPPIVYRTKVPAGSFSSSEAVSFASSEKRSELRASESESEVLAGSTWVVFPQSVGKSCDLKHLVHLAYLWGSCR